MNDREVNNQGAEEWIAGKHAVAEALRAGRDIHKIWIAEQSRKPSMQPIVAEAKRRQIVVQYVDRVKLDQMVPEIRHQGIVAQVAAYRYADIEDLLAAAKRRNAVPFFVILDEIEDSHNLGSILRTADCAGAHGVIVPKRRSAGLTAAVAKTSAGAVEHVPVARVTNLARTIERLKEEGVWIVGADPRAERTVYETDLTVPIAVVIGNENSGISRLVGEKCDFLAKLPMFGQINSLNASVAAALFMYEVVRQRNIPAT
jgi:23S rRNA (guanosine2251-2'-O)-methyltransferase